MHGYMTSGAKNSREERKKRISRQKQVNQGGEKRKMQKDGKCTKIKWVGKKKGENGRIKVQKEKLNTGCDNVRP